MTKSIVPSLPVNSWQDLRRNTWLGFRLGLIIGLLLIFLVSIWNTVWNRSPIAHSGVTFQMLALIYIGGAAAAGTIAGLLSPVARWHLGAIGIGAVAMMPIYFGFGIAVDGASGKWKAGGWVSSLVCSLAVGGILGHKWWDSHEELRPEKRSLSDSSPTPPRKFRPWK